MEPHERLIDHLRIGFVEWRERVMDRGSLIAPDALFVLWERLSRTERPAVPAGHPPPSPPVPGSWDEDDDDDCDDGDDFYGLGVGHLDRMILMLRRVQLDASSGRLVLRPRSPPASPSPSSSAACLAAITRRAVDGRHDSPAAAAA